MLWPQPAVLMKIALIYDDDDDDDDDNDNDDDDVADCSVDRVIQILLCI